MAANYMHVSELNNDELYQLKTELFYGYELMDNLTYAQRKEIYYSEFPEDIPDGLVFTVYDDISFVKEDFFCNCK